MRQREWMRSTDPVAMLWTASLALHIPSKAELAAMRRRRRKSGRDVTDYPFESEAARARRQFRVFTLTAGRPVFDRVDNAVCRAVADVGWRAAEGAASAEEIAASEYALQAAFQTTVDAARMHFETPPDISVLLRFINVLALLFRAPDAAARNLIVPQSFFSSELPVPLLTPAEAGDCCRLIREVFGLHRGCRMPPYWRPHWATDTVLLLARQMYELRDFGAMPILADALQDAGCDNDDILSHCRDPKSHHVRGCWVVDMVLGKA